MQVAEALGATFALSALAFGGHRIAEVWRAKAGQSRGALASVGWQIFQLAYVAELPNGRIVESSNSPTFLTGSLSLIPKIPRLCLTTLAPTVDKR